MTALLDTHAFLWWVTDFDRLPAQVRDIIAAPDNEIFLSVVSVWEIAIKARLGKIRLPNHAKEFLLAHTASNDFRSLPVERRHAVNLVDLPLHHRDPFDRMLISQSQVEQLPILTGDRSFAGYQVQVIW